MSTITEPEQLELPLPPHSEAHLRRGRFFLCLTVACVGFAIMMQMGLNANFLQDEMGVDPHGVGALEAARESCGILALGILALLAGLAEPLIASGMILLFAVGLGAYAVVPNYAWLVVASLVWSQGLHVWMPLPHSMVLSLAEPGQTGRRLGQAQAAGAVGSALGLGAALALTYLQIPIRPMYLLAGAVGLAGAAAILGVPRDIKTPGPRLVLRRRYGLFYLLSFLEGWRKQIFVAFAGYLLVREFDTPLSHMLLLWVGVQVAGWVTSPLVGRLIDHVGERKVLVFYFSSLMLFFTGYAFIRNRDVLYAIFAIDNAFFVFAMALTTYVRRIAPPSEHTATLSMGVAFNHVAAVTMPLVGGLLWHYLGYEWAFLTGALAALASIPCALLLPKHEPSPQTQKSRD